MNVSSFLYDEEGTVATVKLPFRLRGGTHTNWVSAADLPPVKRT